MEEGNQYEIFSQKTASNFKGFFINPLIKRKGFNNFLIKCFVFYSPLKVAPSADYASLAFFSSYDYLRGHFESKCQNRWRLLWVVEKVFEVGYPLLKRGVIIFS